MKPPKISDSDRQRLTVMQAELGAVRAQLGVHAPEEVVFEANLYQTGNEKLLVVADGLGGAELMVVEGNYPIDYFTKRHLALPNEDEAHEIAEKIIKRPTRAKVLLPEV